MRLGGEVGPQQHVGAIRLARRDDGERGRRVAADGGVAGARAEADRCSDGRASALLYGGALIPLGLLAWKVGCSLAFGDAMVAWPERPGEQCLSLSLLVAAGPLLSFLAIRRSAPVQPALNGAVDRLRRRRVRVGRRGPVVSGRVCAARAARPRAAPLRARRRGRAARASTPVALRRPLNAGALDRHPWMLRVVV